MINIKCDSCKAEYNLKDELAGKKAKCPNCSSIIDIPGVVAWDSTNKSIFEALATEAGNNAQTSTNSWPSIGISSNQLNNKQEDAQSDSQGKSLFWDDWERTNDVKKSWIYSHHIYWVKQKKLAINEKYFIRDKDNKDIMFSIRKVYILKWLLSVAVFLWWMFLTFIWITLTIWLESIASIIMLIIWLMASIVASIAIFPKRHIEFFETEDSDKLAEFIILQDKKFEIINKTFTLKDKHWNILAIFRKNLFTDILRKTWHIEFEWKHIIVKEDSVILSILRRIMPYGQLIRINFIFINATHNPNSSDVIGYFKRKFELFDNYLLDLSNDVAFSVPRQIAICMAVLLDTWERR